MSHFAVLVAGPKSKEELAAVLQPYHEFECTGVNDQYVKEVDRTAEVLADAANFEKEDREKGAIGIERMAPLQRALEDIGLDLERQIADGETPDIEGEHRYGYAVLDASGGLIRAVRRTNPDAKWDWWIVGGRYTGLFKLKTGAEGKTGERGAFDHFPKAGWADVCRRDAVDIGGMRADAAREAAERFDAVHAVIDAFPVPQAWVPMVTAAAGTTDIEKAFSDEALVDAMREKYHSQPAVKAASEAAQKAAKNSPLRDLLWGSVDKYLVPREQYISFFRERALSTFAFIDLEGKWHERGQMHWFAVVSDEKSEQAWLEEFHKFFDALAPEVMLWNVDCHI